MFKKIFLCFIIISGLFLMGACANTKSSVEKNTVQTVNISNEELTLLVDSLRYDKLFKQFTKKTGCTITPVLNENMANAFHSLTESELKNVDLVYHASIYAIDEAIEKNLLKSIPPMNHPLKNNKLIDSSGYWISDFVEIYTLFINDYAQQELKVSKPEKIQDMEDGQFTGRITLLNPYYQGLTVYTYLQENSENFSKHQYQYVQSNSEGLKSLEDSSQYAGILSIDKEMIDASYKNNISLSGIGNMIIWEPRVIIIPAHSTKEKVIQVFLDFIFSKEGQEILAEIEGADTIQLANMEAKGYNFKLAVKEMADIDHGSYMGRKKEILEGFLTNN